MAFLLLRCRCLLCKWKDKVILDCSLVAKPCLTLWDPVDCSLLGSFVHWISQARTRAGCHFLFLGIFLTQESNPHLLLGRHILYLWVTWEAPPIGLGALNLMTSVSLQGERTHMIHIHEEGHGTMEAEIGLNAPIRQKKSRISRHHQKLERGQKDSTLELSEGAWSCQQFEFKLLDYRSARESIFTVLRHPVYGNWL